MQGSKNVNKRTLISFGAVLLMLALVTVTVAAMPYWHHVSGTYWYAGPYENVTLVPHGANCIVECDGSYDFDGDLDGIATMHFVILSHGSCDEAVPGALKSELTAEGSFTGTVLGKDGGFTFDYKGKEWPAGPGEQSVKVKYTVTSGSGELKDLRGKFDVSYVMGDDFDSYDGKLYFED